MRPLPFLALAAIISATSLQAQTAPTEKENEEVITLPEFQVSAERRPDEYIASEAISGTRANAKIIELPYNVQAITEEFINDFTFFESDQQLAAISGYSPGATEGGNGPQGSRLRGFAPVVLRDGFSRVGIPDSATIRQVEIIKGPQSTLYGRAQPGGMVNYVSKRPKKKPEYRISALVGSYEFQRFMVEATGPIIADKLHYFAAASYNYNEGDLDHYFMRAFIAGAGFSYTFSPQTSVTLSFEHQERSQNRGAATELRVDSRPVTATDPLRQTGGVVTGPYLPLINFNQYGPNNHVVRDSDNINLLFEHRINSVWSFRFNSQYYERYFDEVRRTGAQFLETTQRFNETSPFASTTWESGAALQADLLARFRTGSVGHMVLLAGDWARDKLRREDYQLPDRAAIMAQPAEVRFLDPANPDWTPIDRALLTRRSNFFLRDIQGFGAFASHRAFFLNNRLITMLGVRRDEVDADFEAPVVGSGRKGSTSYVLGANYKVFNNDSLVLFGNRSTAFDPRTTIDAGTGEPQDNERSAGWELGIKSLAFDQRLAFTLSTYEIKKLNIPNQNPDYNDGAVPGVPQFLGQGVERARGAELDMSLRLTPSVTILGSAGYMNARVIESPDDRSLEGDVLLRIPKLTGSMTVRYAFRRGWLKGVRTGVSGSYLGGVLVGRESASRLREERGPIRLANAFASYGWRTDRKYSHSIQVNVLNLTDEFYLDVSGRKGRGREFRTSYRLSF